MAKSEKETVDGRIAEANEAVKRLGEAFGVLAKALDESFKDVAGRFGRAWRYDD